jgi:hypothetical protein
MLNTQIMDALDKYAAARIAHHDAKTERQIHFAAIEVNGCFSFLELAIQEYAESTARIMNIRDVQD